MIQRGGMIETKIIEMYIYADIVRNEHQGKQEHEWSNTLKKKKKSYTAASHCLSTVVEIDRIL